MSDSDSLDGLVDDIDIDSLASPSHLEQSTKSALSTSHHQKPISSEEDLDDLLEDFFSQKETSKPSEKTIITNEDGHVDDDDIKDEGLIHHLNSQRRKDLEKVLRSVPDARIKKKWIGILEEANKTASSHSPGKPKKRSYTYLEWMDPVEHFSADKSFRNMVLRATSKSRMDDTKAKCVQDILFDDKNLLKKYCQLIINEKRSEILNDPDYDATQYPSLHKALSSI